MIDYINDPRKKDNLIQFVNATKEIIREEGMQNVSIRHIAALSAFHNSTIYLYFNDLDELTTLASVMRLQEYSAQLGQLSLENKDDYDTFYLIWNFYCTCSFRYPYTYSNLFFGKYSNDLHTVLNTYYDLYPEERIQYSANIESMYYGHNLFDRCMQILDPLTRDGRTRVTNKNKALINNITISCYRELLNKKCTDFGTDISELTHTFMEMLHFVVDK